jgi:hypothetical protein
VFVKRLSSFIFSFASLYLAYVPCEVSVHLLLFAEVTTKRRR